VSLSNVKTSALVFSKTSGLEVAPLFRENLNGGGSPGNKKGLSRQQSAPNPVLTSPKFKLHFESAEMPESCPHDPT
jgi:hypothetical protein